MNNKIYIICKTYNWDGDYGVDRVKAFKTKEEALVERDRLIEEEFKCHECYKGAYIINTFELTPDEFDDIIEQIGNDDAYVYTGDNDNIIVYRYGYQSSHNTVFTITEVDNPYCEEYHEELEVDNAKKFTTKEIFEIFNKTIEGHPATLSGNDINLPWTVNTLLYLLDMVNYETGLNFGVSFGSMFLPVDSRHPTFINSEVRNKKVKIVDMEPYECDDTYMYLVIIEEV